MTEHLANRPAPRVDRSATTTRVELPLVALDPDLPLPGYAHDGDAGADLVARVEVTLDPGERATVPTGVAVAIPDGYAGFVHPRSGLAARYGVTTLNAPGTIDAGYRGEIQVTLINTDLRHAVTVRRGDRIAQLVVQQVSHAEFRVVQELPSSERGTGGHGSTGGFVGRAARPGTNVGVDSPEGEQL